MGASNCPDLAFPKDRPRVLVKADKACADKANWERVKRQVRKRDKCMCRRCGKFTFMPPHHLVFKSLGGKDTTENCLLLCKTCHPLAQQHVIEPSQMNANKKIVWRKVR